MNPVGNLYVPYVVESTLKGETRHDLFSRLLVDRVVMLGSPINDQVANLIVAQLLFLNSQSADDDITMFINSPGGVITSGMAIYDTMQFIGADVKTVCVGQCASMGAVLLAAGTKGKRQILPHSRVLIHQPLGGAHGQASDIEISFNEIQRWKHVLNGILSERTGQPLERVIEDTDRDFIMNAKQALEYGIVDTIIGQQATESNDDDETDYKDVDWGGDCSGNCS
jgi:ATP-dependent Clp protease protease subunit